MNSIAESRLYTFIDSSKNFTINFLDGQKLVSDWFTLSQHYEPTQKFFKEFLLTFPFLKVFNKSSHDIGVYFDSKEPFFQCKMEFFSKNELRTLIIPENFQAQTNLLDGFCRLQQFHPGNGKPYTSILECHKTSPIQLLRDLFKSSFQIESHIHYSDVYNQSYLIHHLPRKNNKEIADFSIKDRENFQSFISKISTPLDNISKLQLNDLREIVETIEEMTGLQYLQSKMLKIGCRCSKERVLSSLSSLSLEDRESLFDSQKIISVDCEYCKKIYEIKETDFLFN